MASVTSRGRGDVKCLEGLSAARWAMILSIHTSSSVPLYPGQVLSMGLIALDVQQEQRVRNK